MLSANFGRIDEEVIVSLIALAVLYCTYVLLDGMLSKSLHESNNILKNQYFYYGILADVTIGRLITFLERSYLLRGLFHIVLFVQQMLVLSKNSFYSYSLYYKTVFVNYFALLRYLSLNSLYVNYMYNINLFRDVRPDVALGTSYQVKKALKNLILLVKS